MDAAAALLGPRMEMHATTKHLEGTRVREGGAAFGRLAELATRKSARVAVKQNQNQLEEANQNQNQPCSTLTSLPRQPFSERQPCSYSRQWLLTHRAHCGGSPLRPPSVAPRGVSNLWAPAAPTAPSAAAPAAGKLPPKLDRSLWGDVEPAQDGLHGAALRCEELREDHTPDSIQSLLSALEETRSRRQHP